MDIYDLIIVPKNRRNKVTSEEWELLEKQINCKLPADYKSFVTAYGVGCINNFLWILGPCSTNSNLDYYGKFLKMQSAYNYLRNKYPEEFPKFFFDGENGLLPWGVTDNGDELYLEKTGCHWKIVIFGSRYWEIYEYNMTVTDFLFEILNGTIECELISDALRNTSNSYTYF